MSDGAKNGKPIQRTNRTILRRTLFLLGACGVVAFIVLVSRLYQIQIVDHEHYQRRALAQQLRQTTITASRGTIYDRSGNILAISASVENVFISPAEMRRNNEDPEFIADGLAAILEGVDRETILQRLERSNSWYEIVKYQVEAEEATLVREFISENRLRSVHLEPATRRYYPNSSLASQVIGFVGRDNTGLDGIELRYERYLEGINGRVVRLRNARGTELLFTNYEDFFDAQDGHNVTLTVDSAIQHFVEKHLAQAIVDYDILNGAAAIVMDVRTGGILAIANYPNFDPNNFNSILSDREQERLDLITDPEEYSQARSAARYRQWRNMALSDTYEPGSVFKIITFAMALEENLVSLDSTFHCGGAMNVIGRDSELRCWRRHGHGSLTLSGAMQHSCNIATVNMGLRIGAETFYRYAEAFGLFDRTGLDNVAEGTPLWWSENVFFDRNNQSQLASASFGQTFKITPIQMATAVAATINGGYLMQPHIVKQVTDANGNIMMAAEPTVVRQVVSAETSAIMREILEDTVTIGTGRNAQVAGFRIGGKTGTSENIEALVQNEDGNSRIVSFAGFAPADDPEVLVLVLMDTPSQSTGIHISGGVMAAPVVGNMLADILQHLEIRPQYTIEQRQDLNVSVPRFLNNSVEEAAEMLANHGFEVEVIGDGNEVTWQLPAPNGIVTSGTRVRLYAGEDIPEHFAAMPNLAGMSYENARAQLEQLGFFIRTIGVPKSDTNAIISIQSIQAGSYARYGSVVEVTLIDRQSLEMQLEV